MTTIYWRGFVLYVYGQPVSGTGWNVWFGANSGAFIGMDDFGNAIRFSRGRPPHGAQ